MTLRLPAGAVARLHIHPRSDMPFVVAIACPPVAPHVEAICRRGAISAVLTHGQGVRSPDEDGCLKAEVTLNNGGGVLLVFETMADALACHASLVIGGGNAA